MSDSREQVERVGLLLTESKEELVDEILRLRRELRELKERLAEAAAKEAERKSRQYERSKPKARWKKLGAPVGHHGATRPKPDHIDKTIDQHLDFCPDCGSNQLSSCPSATEEHIQEDIIPARVEVTKFVHHGYWCPSCHQVKVAGYAPEEVPYGYLGPKVLVLVIRMKYYQGLSYEKIENRLFEFATGTFAAKHWQRISARMLKYYREMLTFLKVPGLPSDNNHAERMIRPNVIFRKISFQNMSVKGARAHEVLMSLLQTLRLQNMESSTFFKRAYLAHRQGRPNPLLQLGSA